MKTLLRYLLLVVGLFAVAFFASPSTTSAQAEWTKKTFTTPQQVNQFAITLENSAEGNLVLYGGGSYRITHTDKYVFTKWDIATGLPTQTEYIRGSDGIHSLNDMILLKPGCGYQEERLLSLHGNAVPFGRYVYVNPGNPFSQRLATTMPHPIQSDANNNNCDIVIVHKSTTNGESLVSPTRVTVCPGGVVEATNCYEVLTEAKCTTILTTAKFASINGRELLFIVKGGHPTYCPTTLTLYEKNNGKYLTGQQLATWHGKSLVDFHILEKNNALELTFAFQNSTLGSDIFVYSYNMETGLTFNYGIPLEEKLNDIVSFGFCGEGWTTCIAVETIFLSNIFYYINELQIIEEVVRKPYYSPPDLAEQNPSAVYNARVTEGFSNNTQTVCFAYTNVDCYSWEIPSAAGK